MEYTINDFDVVFLSYDEPNKEENWAKLSALIPWAKRVDGVKGFDSAHKACAEIAETDRFITVDGDNIVYPEFLDIKLNIPSSLDGCTLSWAGRNIINGLCYGNGGLKLWDKNFVLNMRTHENSVNKNEAVDFCWDPKYIQLNNVYSDTCPNATPVQAFKAGFREGVKLTLDRGEKIVEGKISKCVHEKNYKRLLIWASVGADIDNGEWAIYGARFGIFMTNVTHATNEKFAMDCIGDYEWFDDFWQIHQHKKDEHDFLIPLKKTLGMNIANLNADQSAFFKSVYEPPRRSANPIATEIEANRE